MKKLNDMNNLVEYARYYGMDVHNDYGEYSETYVGKEYASINFENGYRASILIRYQHDYDYEPDSNMLIRYSIAVCDWNGWFEYDKLSNCNNVGCVWCDTEEEIIKVLEEIRNL